MENLFICYSKCSTCKKARKWLEENDIKFVERDIKEDRPNADELKSWIDSRPDLKIRRFFNTSGMKYRELKLKDKLDDMTEEEQIELLASDGMLVKRPIFVGEGEVLVAFKEEEWEEKLK